MPRWDSIPQSQQASPRLRSRGHWDRHGVVSNPSAPSAVPLLWHPLEPVYCLDCCTQIFRPPVFKWQEGLQTSSPFAELVQKLQSFCVFGKLTALFTAARQWSLYRVRWSQNIRKLRCSGYRSFEITHFIIVFFHFSWLVPTEWNGATRLRAWWGGWRSSPPACCPNMQISAGCQSVCRCEFHCLPILWKWLWFNDFVLYPSRKCLCF